MAVNYNPEPSAPFSSSPDFFHTLVQVPDLSRSSTNHWLPHAAVASRRRASAGSFTAVPCLSPENKVRSSKLVALTLCPALHPLPWAVSQYQMGLMVMAGTIHLPARSRRTEGCAGQKFEPPFRRPYCTRHITHASTRSLKVAVTSISPQLNSLRRQSSVSSP
ncbi:hypothetical protein CGMCC3_g980 [Colletotrichum fructicola]|nr:uncharacterized protein CGMCC3_g980 [Colletotrichum fructicola]KAE9583338.1 hypothetical protein CGMCC3_g980 [Colletotrichum fructicola]